MYLVIKEDYRRIDYSEYAYEIEMHSNDYSLAVDFADCKQREADEQGQRDYTFKVVEFPSNFKFDSEIEADGKQRLKEYKELVDSNNVN